MADFLILTDHQGYVASSLLPGDGRKISAEKLKEFLERYQNHAEIISMHKIRFPSRYQGYYVIYPSSEDRGLRYKDYIEDVVLALYLDGAVLLPRFELFRAHHNKVFMEMQRGRMSDEYKTISSEAFYSVKDLRSVIKDTDISYPAVLKTSAGAGSAGVALAKDRKDLLRKAGKMNRAFYFDREYNLKRILCHKLGKMKRRLLGRLQRIQYAEKEDPRQKMILQNYIPGLKNDYKVLVFGKKLYLLKRLVRDNDFRASGSGRLEFVEKLSGVETGILDFAYQAYTELDTPLLSIDIAWDGRKCHMIEFQCINFGPYALQYSQGYYTKKNGKWCFKQGKPVLEKEMARAYTEFVSKKQAEFRYCEHRRCEQ